MMTWTPEDVEFLVQVASQIAIAVENSLTYRELAEMKERLATEKLYLEDEIRLDHNIGNMVGEGTGFSSRSEEYSDRGADGCNRSHNGRDRHGKRTRRPGNSRIERPQQGQFRQSELRGDSRQPAGKRTVRAREGLVHRSGCAEDRTLRTGASRARCFSTRSAKCRSNSSRSCCAPFRTRNSSAWAALARSGPTPGSWPPRTGT